MHGLEPLVISLHPAEIVLFAGLVAECCRVGLSAVCGSGRYSYACHELVLSGITVGEQPHEVRRVVVRRNLSVEVAVCV